MRSLRPLLFVSALLLTGWSALAQSSPDKGKWSGRASLTAGYGWSMPDGEAGEADTLQRFHQSAEVVARYETRKFSVATRLSQLQDRNETERIKMVYKTTKEGDEVSQLDLILRASNPRQKRYEARTDFRWRTSDRSTLSWYVGYVDIHNVTVNTMGQFQLIADREETSVEDVDGRQRTSLSGFRGNVNFAGQQVILGGFDWNREWNWRQTHWERIGATFEDLRRSYRLTPFFIRDRSTAFFTYRDSTMFGVPRLRFEAGSRMTLNRDNDRYGGATLRANGTWQDSLRVKEHFDFIAAQLEPYGRVDWNRDSISLYLETGLQLYGTRLDNDTLHQALSVRPPVVVGALGGRWRPAPKHTVTWSASWNVQRPGFLERPASRLPEHLLVPAAGELCEPARPG